MDYIVYIIIVTISSILSVVGIKIYDSLHDYRKPTNRDGKFGNDIERIKSRETEALRRFDELLAEIRETKSDT